MRSFTGGSIGHLLRAIGEGCEGLSLDGNIRLIRPSRENLPESSFAIYYHPASTATITISREVGNIKATVRCEMKGDRLGRAQDYLRSQGFSVIEGEIN